MRLPTFLTEKPLIGAVLDASDAGTALLEADVNRRNDQLSYRTADEGLRRWERDLSLPSDGDAATRRARIYAALTGGRTLTVEELEKLALTLTDAREAVVTEKFANYLVVLTALFDGEAGDLTALRRAVERRKPAHLNIRVQSTLPKEQIVYYGLATPLGAAGENCGVTMENHALFVGDRSCDAYDALLVHSTVDAVLSGGHDAVTAKAGDYAVHSGGWLNNATTVYDNDLVRSSLSSPIVDRYRIAAASTKNHALFGGGEMTEWEEHFDSRVDAVSADLTASVPTAFREAKGYWAACPQGEYAVIAGGMTSYYPRTYTNTVDVYGAELQRLSAPELTEAVVQAGAAGTKTYAIIAGGVASGERRIANANAYAPDFTKVAIAPLSVPREGLCSFSFAERAIFAGGYDGAVTADVDCYDDELTHSILQDISISRASCEGGKCGGCTAVIGNFGLIAGGWNGYWEDDCYFDTVDVFTVE